MITNKPFFIVFVGTPKGKQEIALSMLSIGRFLHLLCTINAPSVLTNLSVFTKTRNFRLAQQMMFFSARRAGHGRAGLGDIQSIMHAFYHRSTLSFPNDLFHAAAEGRHGDEEDQRGTELAREKGRREKKTEMEEKKKKKNSRNEKVVGGRQSQYLY